MHILVTNDDGPPSPHSSPYVATLVAELKKAGHTVSAVRPLYYRPSEHLHGEQSQGTTHSHPTTADPNGAPGNFDADAEWVLVNGTPASCIQLGLHHLFKHRGPVDLVVSGPNYGRNTTAVFALSSGTLGGALEAAVCGHRAIALSFAFFTRNHDPVVIEGAARHGVRVIEKLYADWPADRSLDLYSVNVPLVEGVEKNKTIWAKVLQNYWREGSCFEEVVGGSAPDGDAEEERIREGAEGEVQGGVVADLQGSRYFKWSPKFGEVYKSVEEAGPGNDGWIVQEGHTSVTPLKANFWHAAEHLYEKELVLPAKHEGASPKEPKFYALIDYGDDYVQPLIMSAMKSLAAEGTWAPLSLPPSSETTNLDEPVSLGALLPDPTARVLQIMPYEALDFDHAASHPKSTLINSYIIRKALIRKHYLSATVETWVAKNPGSALQKGVKRSEHFEVDYAEFLDDALVEAFDLRESLDRNEEKESAAEREWWILKPGMSDRGQGIKLFSTMDELQGIFDEWEEERPDSDDEDEAEDGADEGKDYIVTSHLRHFVVQPYIHPPMPLAGDGRKFHLRVYVLAVGSLKVYVYDDVLVLFAAKPYSPPWESGNEDLDVHLTNTCLRQGRFESGSGSGSESLPAVQRLRDLVSSGALPRQTGEDIMAQIRTVTGDLFEAAARGMPIHFQPLENAFEVFGLDFLVDAAGTAWLLEVNAFPDFRQTGTGEAGVVVEGFWRETVRVAVGGFFGV
ncbi:hypothetical protein ACRALDRAFT_1011429, partial [Sodiomyces alcalophilus JCM 7366]|uniref:uncharacterized protein n=1 Tax=Sodiomyces alcalophilus JCM 7366 TaxID=591952 RepID=UPI0039B63CE4